MPLPRPSRDWLFAIGVVVLAGAAGASLTLLSEPATPHGVTSLTQPDVALTSSPAPEETVTAAPTATATLTGTPTPTPTPSGTPTPSPSPTAAATASVPVTSTQVPVRTPSATPTSGTQMVAVRISGPKSVKAGDTATYTLSVSWTKQKPANIDLLFNSTPLPRSGDCGSPTPPSNPGPGAYSEQYSHTWAAGQPQNFVNALAYTECQYYVGADSEHYVVTVTDPPSPTDSATPQAS